MSSLSADGIMACRPSFLNETRRYKEVAAGETWVFADAAWSLRPRIPSDSAIAAITADISILPGEEEAFIRMGLRCGSLCGEGWTYRLRRSGRIWRVISAQWNWVS
jgi:hypothetical protein